MQQRPHGRPLTHGRLARSTRHSKSEQAALQNSLFDAVGCQEMIFRPRKCECRREIRLAEFGKGQTCRLPADGILYLIYRTNLAGSVPRTGLPVPNILPLLLRVVTLCCR